MTAAFRRRTYAGAAPLWRDLRFLLAHRRAVRAALGGGLSLAFRERLMLAVTAVNECRYCARFHGRVALGAGLAPAEVEALLAGSAAGAPPEERPALLYAHYWAERDAAPEPEAYRELVAVYGAERAEEIEAALRLIRIGNLSGNGFDALIFRLSGGRWGLTRREREAAAS